MYKEDEYVKKGFQVILNLAKIRCLMVLGNTNLFVFFYKGTTTRIVVPLSPESIATLPFSSWVRA